MAEVTLEIGDRRYDVTCRDGEEDHLRHLASLVNGKAAEARAAVGGVNEVRQLLFASLLLADELNDARGKKPVETAAEAVVARADSDGPLAAALERLADRVEAVADALLPEDVAG